MYLPRQSHVLWEAPTVRPLSLCHLHPSFMQSVASQGHKHAPDLCVCLSNRTPGEAKHGGVWAPPPGEAGSWTFVAWPAQDPSWTATSVLGSVPASLGKTGQMPDP